VIWEDCQLSTLHAAFVSWNRFFVQASTIIPMTFDGGNASLDGLVIACTATIWLLSIGVGTIFSALYAKARRISTIMQSAQRFRRIKVSTRDTLIPVFVLLSRKFLDTMNSSVVHGRICAPLTFGCS